MQGQIERLDHRLGSRLDLLEGEIRRLRSSTEQRVDSLRNRFEAERQARFDRASWLFLMLVAGAVGLEIGVVLGKNVL